MSPQHDLGVVGVSPRHTVVVQRVGRVLEAAQGEFRVSLGKTTPAVELKRALGFRLGVRADDIKLGHEGRDVEDATSLQDVCSAIPRRPDRAVRLVYELESGAHWLLLDERLAEEQARRDAERERQRAEELAAERRQAAEERLYRMCPRCHAGPLLNLGCQDMETHHGECPRCHTRSPSGAAWRSGRPSARIPRCESCNVPVIFNGCMACGHLFTGQRWRDLPAWQGARDRVAA